MKKKVAIFLSLLTFIVIVSSTRSSFAQANSHWKKIGQLVDTIGYSNAHFAATCGYFWNAWHGLVATLGGKIYYTTDGGTHWNASVCPPTAAGLGIFRMTSIHMKDSITGWASLSTLWSLANMLWKTTDAGHTWNDVPGYVMGYTNPVPGFPGGVGVGITEVSQDKDGTLLTLTWRQDHFTFSGSDALAIAWISPLEALVDCRGGILGSPNHNYITHNGGINWQTIPLSPFEAWGVYGVPKWRDFFLAPENDAGFFISTNAGNSWIQSSIRLSTTGDVEGGPAVAYVQGNQDSGLYRTTDTGKTWVSIGGPSNHRDTRFCVTGCDGNVVVAFDETGGVWETTDGGDGMMGRSQPQFSATTLSLSSKLCTQNLGTIKVEGVECNPFVLDSIAFIDSSLVRLGVLSIDSSPVLPETFDSGRSDLIRFRWNPSAAFSEDTTVHTQVFLRYLDGATGVERDTILSLTLVAQAPAMSVNATPNVNFSTVSTCAYADSIITLVNNSCVPVRIDSLALYSNDYSILSSDSIIPPGDTARISVRFKPNGANPSQAYLMVYLNQLGVHGFVSVNLSGSGSQGFGVLAMHNTSLQAGSFSFCDGDTALTDTIRNTGCDTLVLSKIRFGNDSAFALLASPDSLLLPGASGVFQFLFSPRKKGAHAGTLSFHWQNIVNDPGHDTTVTISGNGLGGNTALALDTTTRNFGNLFECEERDTTIWLYNPGCDTLRVDSAAFPNAAYASDTSFPLLIPAGDSVPVRISLISNISPNPGSDNGAVTFYSNANTGSQSGTVQLLAKPIPPAQLHLTLSPAQSAHAGQLVNFYVILTGDTGPAARELTGISFDLTHNDDLLSFVSASGMTRVNHPLPPPWKGGGIQRDTFVFTPPTFQGGGRGVVDTIGTLTFRVYLTDSSTTPLTLSNIAFGVPPNISPDCIASIDSGASGFTYLYQCGDHILQDYLRTGSVPFHIESIVPNPATTEIIIRVVGGEDGRVVGGVPAAPIEYELFNALGKRVLTSSDVPGSDVRGTSLQLDVSALPSGIYFLRISRDGYMQSQSVAIER